MMRSLFCLTFSLAALASCREKPTSDVGLPPADAPTTQAPAVFRTRFETSKGVFVVETTRSWAPLGADRFYHLVRSGYFDNNRFFRVVTGFMVQFGVHGDPAVNKAWEPLNIADDSVSHSNERGTITFATKMVPNTRATQVFINLVNNHALDAMGFAPIGRVIQGMEVVDSLYAGYGESPPGGFGPNQMRLMEEGNSYLERNFPKLDFVRTARILPDSAKGP